MSAQTFIEEEEQSTLLVVLYGNPFIFYMNFSNILQRVCSTPNSQKAR